MAIRKQANQENSGSNNSRNFKPADAWARVRVVQMDSDGNPARDESGDVITHYLCNDIPFYAKSAAQKGIIELAEQNPGKTFTCQMTVNVPNPDAEEKDPILSF